MKFISLQLENFLAYRGFHEIDFTEIQQCTVSGVNASGKSTLILDSILFALYGQARQKGEACLSLGEKDGYVVFRFQHRDKIYTVTRYLNSGKTSKLDVQEDGKTITESTLRTTQTLLENKILGFSKNLFLTICVSVQGQIDFFAQQDPKQKEDLLSEIVQYEGWEKRKSLAMQKLKEVGEQKQQYMYAVKLLKEYENKLQVCQSELQNIKKERNIKQTGFSSLAEEIKTLEGKVEKIKSFLDIRSQLVDMRKGFVEEQKQIKLKLIDLEEASKYLSVNSVVQLEQRLRDLDAEQIQCGQSIEDAQQRISDSRELLHVYLNVQKELDDTAFIDDVPCVGLEIHSRCQLLSQAILRRTEANEVVQSIVPSTIEREIHTLSGNIEYSQNTITEIKKNSVRISTEKNSVKDSLALAKIHENTINKTDNDFNLIRRNDELEISIKQCDAKLEEHANDLPLLATYKEKKTYYENFSKQLDEFNRKTVFLESQETLFQQEIAEQNKNLKSFYGLETEEREWKLLSNLYDRIPTVLLSEIIPVIEDEANKILQILNVQYQIKIPIFQEVKSTQQQKRSFEIIYSSGVGDIPFDSLSGSEKFKQALALRIALSKTLEQLTGNQLGVFVIDEGFGSLDQEGIQDVKIVLQALANQFNFFCVITHIEELKDVFDTQIIIQPTLLNKIQVVN